MEAEQDRTQGQTGAHSEDLGHQYVQRPSGSRCLLSCGGKMLVKSTEYTNTDIHARLGIYLRLEKDAFTFQLTLCCEISSVFKVSGSNLTSFPHMEQSKHRFDLKTCRLLYADIFLFTGNQTVTSAVQEEGETVPSLIWLSTSEQHKTCLRSLSHCMQCLWFRVFWQMKLNTEANTVIPEIQRRANMSLRWKNLKTFIQNHYFHKARRGKSQQFDQDFAILKPGLYGFIHTSCCQHGGAEKLEV